MKTFTKRNVLALCQLAITFILITNVPATYAQLECNSLGPPLVTTGSIAAADPDQTGRLFRDGRNTTCLFDRTPTIVGSTPVSFDQYTFTNTESTPVCVFVDLDATGCGGANNQIQMAAYTNTFVPTNVLANRLADNGLSTGTNFATSMSFTVPAGGTYVIVVSEVNPDTNCPAYTFTRRIFNGCRAPGYDAANDGSADLALFRPSGGFANFFSLSLSGGSRSTQFGSAGDIPVPGDYNGDEATDVAVYRPSIGTWFTSTNPATNYGARRWGLSGDIPVQGDYDRDGITDLAVFRPSNNTWYILRSSNTTLLQLTFGNAGDKPVPADYDGDGKTDLALFRPSNGLWTVVRSSGNNGSLTYQLLYGISTDIPVPADYDGDAKADIAVFRPSSGNWFVLRSSETTNQSQMVQFGASGDVPQPADYDGDRRADQAVFRPSNNTWYLLRSTAGAVAVQFGLSGDQPVSSPILIP